ncbi:MAG TPA: diaminopimelate decarboxylase [Myxococcota bacterium]|nr:diaminopimelate decarboxylase [Myxococcota bacterium]
MHLDDVYEVSTQGVMLLGGHDVRELVREYGSPLIVMLEERIRTNCRAYLKQIECYPRSRVYYASKAFLTTGMCRLMQSEEMGLDVASEGELQTALAAGFPAADILMHGNAKTTAELELALRSNVGRIVIDNLEEIDRLSEIAAALGRRARVMIRVTPGVRPSTHRYVQTGQRDSKFGFNLDGGAAHRAVERVLAASALELVGLHCHIGSQIFSGKPFAIAARTMMEFYARVKKDMGAPLDELDMGGGLGIRYSPDDFPPSVKEHIDNLCSSVLEASHDLGVDPPVLCDEPGRSIVGRAGVTLYTLQSTKRIAGIRNYASVDGGMTDNPRYALYGARHQVLAADRLGDPADGLWSISGRCCESGDMLIHDARLPDLRAGDIVALMCTGAYTYSMASNYNRVARPAVVLVAPGRSALLARRESADDLLRLDSMPAWLENGEGSA